MPGVVSLLTTYQVAQFCTLLSNGYDIWLLLNTVSTSVPCSPKCELNLYWLAFTLYSKVSITNTFGSLKLLKLIYKRSCICIGYLLSIFFKVPSKRSILSLLSFIRCIAVKSSINLEFTSPLLKNLVIKPFLLESKGAI